MVSRLPCPQRTELDAPGPERGSIGICHKSLALLGIAGAQRADAPSEFKTGIPVNYTEAQGGNYTLPDPLKFSVVS
jgi:hypothetical protein